MRYETIPMLPRMAPSAPPADTNPRYAAAWPAGAMAWAAASSDGAIRSSASENKSVKAMNTAQFPPKNANSVFGRFQGYADQGELKNDYCNGVDRS
jgi:hypothetical protein